ncbi:MAG TPA: pilus assembly protein PilZ [Allosphingosinicella sp.]|nr:pilus assembly protein PilZ [Allosphingosinicella sp.]
MDAWRSSQSPSPGSYGGAILSGEISFGGDRSEEATNSRVSKRIQTEIGAGLRQRGASGVSVEVTDLSTHGFRASTHLELAKGSDVWLRLPGLEPCHATVAWSKGNLIGCAFERPLHPAVLDMILRRVGSR